MIWVVTDSQGYILGLPPMPSAVNFDNPGAGTCLIWNLAVNGIDSLGGLAMGLNANNLTGCFSLSTPVEVIRNNASGCNANGGMLFGGPFVFDVGDGTPDMIPAGSITVANINGANFGWVVTDDLGNILGLPPTPEVVDFDPQGEGICLVWHIAYDGAITGLEVGMNTNNIQGCFSLSNPVTVERNGATAPPVAHPIVMNEISANGQIELLNIGNSTIDISGYWLCNFNATPRYEELAAMQIVCGDLVLSPGELVTVVTNITVNANDGEMGLYTTNSQGFGNPNTITDYVEWGSTGHFRASTAASAGIWTTGDFVPAFSGSTLIYDGAGDSSTDWSQGAASPCQGNVVDPNGPTQSQSGASILSLSHILYPNPAVNSMSLKFDNEIEGVITIVIFDELGRIVKSYDSTPEKPVMIDDLDKGSYYMKVIKDRVTSVSTFMKL